MPIKRFRRIFVGFGATILVVSPLFVAIILRYHLDDSIRYVFHKGSCNGRRNELRIVQVYRENKNIHGPLPLNVKERIKFEVFTKSIRSSSNVRFKVKFKVKVSLKC